MFDPDRFITDRLHAIDASGIRRVFDLAAKLKDPLNLSIGQPDFDVPQVVKDAAIEAIRQGHNRYTVTQGIAELRQKVAAQVGGQFPQIQQGLASGEHNTLITSGVSGGLVLALLTCIGPGDEVLIPDPYFVMYRHLVTLAGGTAVFVDTYPDFQFTAERIEPCITPRTKMLLFNSPSNPTGVVSSASSCRAVAELADQHNILLLSDEIYDLFCYDLADGSRCPSPAAYNPNVLLLRGFSKTYGMTGWRVGFAVGPAAIIDQMTKLQQYSFVCAPSMAQIGSVKAMDVDMSAYVQQYQHKRDLVVQRLSQKFELTVPGGAFYVFPQVPAHLGISGAQFVERAMEHNVLIIPGSVFSERDTHIRISYACDEDRLNRGLDVLMQLAS